MAGEHAPTLYTVEEARALVPRLRVLLTALQVEKRQLDAALSALSELTPAMRANGHALTALRHERRIAELTASMREKIMEITALDIEIKDLDAGLVDFFSLRDGRVVYLCWRVDEPTVAHWHELDTGFAGRRPL